MVVEYIVGKDVFFRLVFNIVIIELFGFEIGIFGIIEERVKKEDIEVVVGKFKGLIKLEYYFGGKFIIVKFIFRKLDRKFIGG